MYNNVFKRFFYFDNLIVKNISMSLNLEQTSAKHNYRSFVADENY